jgi:hypothetical protein
LLYRYRDWSQAPSRARSSSVIAVSFPTGMVFVRTA